jgi:hypothetical protein
MDMDSLSCQTTHKKEKRLRRRKKKPIMVRYWPHSRPNNLYNIVSNTVT